MKINKQYKMVQIVARHIAVLLPLFICTSLLLGLSSCSDDDLSDDSVINTLPRERTPFDDWLDANFLEPYNIDFKYLYDDSETDLDYYLVPADYNCSVIMAHLLKYDCIEAYVEVAGVNFVRKFFPKEFVMLGTWEYRNNHTRVLGTAEGSKTIILMGVNYLASNMYNPEYLNENYFKTVHHEFVHILNQTTDFPTSFNQVTGSAYVSDKWSDLPYSQIYASRGFVSDYAQSEAKEDFAETVSVYLTSSTDSWNALLEKAETGVDAKGNTGRQLIELKVKIAKEYLWNSWKIDLEALRASVQRRGNDIAGNKVDLTNLSLNN